MLFFSRVAGIRCPNEELADYSGTNFPNGDGSPMGTTKSISSDELESDLVEPSYLCDYKMLQPQGSQRVYDAFHLLQTDPSVEVLHQYYLVSVFFIRATAESSATSSTHTELFNTHRAFAFRRKS